MLRHLCCMQQQQPSAHHFYVVGSGSHPAHHACVGSRCLTLVGACCAGQALVQFVHEPRTRQDFAMKFFLSSKTYESELELYRTPGLREFMPAIHGAEENEDGSFCDAFGNPMPPCIVIEKGEPLSDRIKWCKNDVFSIVQVCPQLRILHERTESKGARVVCSASLRCTTLTPHVAASFLSCRVNIAVHDAWWTCQCAAVQEQVSKGGVKHFTSA